MESISDLLKIRIFESDFSPFAKSYDLPAAVNKLYILCQPEDSAVEISVIPNNWRLRPYVERYYCVSGINIICLCKQVKSDWKISKFNKIKISMFNADGELRRDEDYLCYDNDYSDSYIFYLSIENRSFIENPSLEWSIIKKMAFNKIPVDIFYQSAARRLGKRYIKKFSINPLQEFMLQQTENTKNCRNLLGRRLHSEALQSSRRYYSMNRHTYSYLKRKVEQRLFDEIFHSYWSPRFIWLNYDQEYSDSDEE